jgi:hypothetical protein
LRNPNMRTSVPISSAIEKIPTDHASLEAVLGLILVVDSAVGAIGTEGWRRDVSRWARHLIGRVLPRRFTSRTLADASSRRRRTCGPRVSSLEAIRAGLLRGSLFEAHPFSSTKPSQLRLLSPNRLGAGLRRVARIAPLLRSARGASRDASSPNPFCT